MASGVSVIGPQLIFDDGVSDDWGFYLDFGLSAAMPPSRVGYYYLVICTVDTLADALVARTGPVFRPGASIWIPGGVGPGGEGLVLWIDWNVAGLSWDAGTL